ncbi:hypothetical protein D5b_00231 [Faustovirus]|nr:hypothetical protein D5b_00231 [Faustovirus]AMN84683.1 hypothetical protein D6_00280 [Faustovirus]AMP44183.1 hypothetical protein PRJ_Dakar_00227 [Faustovirus]
MQNIIILALAMLAVASAQTYTYCGNATQGGAECTGENDCGGIDAGVCVGGVCVCNEGYYDADCSYKARDSYNLGLWGLFLLIGVGGVSALAAGNLAWGIPQLILTVAPGVAGWAICCCGNRAGGFIQLVWSAFFVWSLATSIIYGIQSTDWSKCDGNGYPIMATHST